MNIVMLLLVFPANIWCKLFMATGFHGFHVIVGTIFLAVCLFRALKGHFTPESHIGFEAAAWYWHFVDVVWLFLFCGYIHLGIIVWCILLMLISSFLEFKFNFLV